MKGIELRFLIPAKQSLRRGEALNLLIGAENGTDEDILFPVRVFAATDGDPVPLMEESKLIPAHEHSHIYLTVPGPVLESIDDDEFVISLENGAFGQMICFY